MADMEPTQPTLPVKPPTPRDTTIEGMAVGETKLYEIHRHFFGLFRAYFLVIIGFFAAAILLNFMLPVVLPNADSVQRTRMLSEILGVVAVVLWLVLVLYTYIYRQSKLIISDKNLTQVLQQGLFRRKVSELSMSNVEDVTANQSGFFASLFGYGDLMVETAGAEDNFDFSFCPKPNFYGKIVLDAKEKFLDSDSRTDAQKEQL